MTLYVCRSVGRSIGLLAIPMVCHNLKFRIPCFRALSAHGRFYQKHKNFPLLEEKFPMTLYVRRSVGWLFDLLYFQKRAGSNAY